MKHIFQSLNLLILFSLLTACQKENTLTAQAEILSVLGTYTVKEICLLPSDTPQKSKQQVLKHWTIERYEKEEGKIFFKELAVYGKVENNLINIPSQTIAGMEMTIVGYGEMVSEELHLYYSLTDHILNYTKTCEVHGVKF